MDIKDILTSIRQNKGYSKRTVSKMTGIPYTTYIKYESGERKDVSMYALCKLADFYGVTTDYLLGRETIEQETPLRTFAKVSNLKALEEILIKEYLELNNQEREAVLDFLRRCIEKESASKSILNNASQSVTITAGELEDQWNTEQNAKNKDAK